MQCNHLRFVQLVGKLPLLIRCTHLTIINVGGSKIERPTNYNPSRFKIYQRVDAVPVCENTCFDKPKNSNDGGGGNTELCFGSTKKNTPKDGFIDLEPRPIHNHDCHVTLSHCLLVSVVLNLNETVHVKQTHPHTQKTPQEHVHRQMKLEIPDTSSYTREMITKQRSPISPSCMWLSEQPREKTAGRVSWTRLGLFWQHVEVLDMMPPRLDSLQSVDTTPRASPPSDRSNFRHSKQPADAFCSPLTPTAHPFAVYEPAPCIRERFLITNNYMHHLNSIYICDDILTTSTWHYGPPIQTFKNDCTKTVHPPPYQPKLCLQLLDLCVFSANLHTQIWYFAHWLHSSKQYEFMELQYSDGTTMKFWTRHAKTTRQRERQRDNGK